MPGEFKAENAMLSQESKSLAEEPVFIVSTPFVRNTKAAEGLELKKEMSDTVDRRHPHVKKDSEAGHALLDQHFSIKDALLGRSHKKEVKTLKDILLEKSQLENRRRRSKAARGEPSSKTRSQVKAAMLPQVAGKAPPERSVATPQSLRTGKGTPRRRSTTDSVMQRGRKTQPEAKRFSSLSNDTGAARGRDSAARRQSGAAGALNQGRSAM